MIETWMTLVGISMSFGSFPQIIKLLKTKSSKDISIIFWFITIHGLCWWEYYGYLIGSICLIITNCICLILDIIVLILVIKYRKNGRNKF